MTEAHTLRPLRTLARTSELHKPEGAAAFVFCADGVLGPRGHGVGAMAVEAGNGDPEPQRPGAASPAGISPWIFCKVVKEVYWRHRCAPAFKINPKAHPPKEISQGVRFLVAKGGP